MIKRKNKNDTIPTETPVSLEGGADLKPARFTDIKILEDAPKYNIDLEALENYQARPVTAAAVNVDDAVAEDKYFWQELDVSLADMTSYVFDDDERPIVMVSDDKIAYLNKAAQNMLELSSQKEAMGGKFLRFVEKGDRDKLASGIGEMLADAAKQTIHLKALSGKIHAVEFRAVYLPDSLHFSFILIGNHEVKPVPSQQIFNNLYDELTGLPNFFLFEDRVQMAVNYENYKDVRLPRDLIAVAAVSIDNIEMFRRLNLESFAIKKLANTLVLSLKKNYTVARGLRYQFWVLMPEIANEHVLKIELEKLRAIFNEGINDNFTTHEVVASIGATVFPKPAHSAKKLVEQAIFALRQAQERNGNRLELFDLK